jgi:phenylalanyl-tRNA synthetase beta subunit
MKISYLWLTDYFEKELPAPKKIAEILTAHAFEVESVESAGEDYLLDIKVLPDRSHDCLSHIGIAREVSALLEIPLKKEFVESKSFSVPESNIFRVDVLDPKLCRRFSALVIENVEVRESPDWLKKRLETIGQRSINNIVDATNYVMFSLGQPLHAYDRALLTDANGGYKITVRNAKEGEKILALDKKEYVLSKENLVITDGNNDSILGIAGIKGGTATEISKNTKHIILESANFDPVNVRKSAKQLGLRTDASLRFENEITPELTMKALSQVSDLILEIASGEKTQVEGMFDWRSQKSAQYKVGVSVLEIQNTLGINVSEKDVEKIFKKNNFSYEIIKNPREHFLGKAVSLVGTKYKFGASVSKDSPEAFDCSGLVAYCAMESGITVPRMSVDQFVFCEPIDEESIKAGDLIFVATKGGDLHTVSKEWLAGTPVQGGIDHVGIMVSKNEVFHTSIHNPDGARKESLEEFFKIRELRSYGRIPAIDAGSRFVVTIPAERLDLRIKEDLIEEIGRIYGYDTLESKATKQYSKSVEINKTFYYADVVRDLLIKNGFSEVFTYAFRNSGEVELQNPLASDKAYLRANLHEGLNESLELNMRSTDLLGLSQIKIFEIGKVFSKDNERNTLAFAVQNTKGFKGLKEDDEVNVIIAEMEKVFGKVNFIKNGFLYEINFDEAIENLPNPTTPLTVAVLDDAKYKQYSLYPFVLRDIAVFVPLDIGREKLLEVIQGEAGELLVSSVLFDEFKKEDKISFAYRLVFQSMDKTLTDEEINKIMEKVSEAINKNGWQVR